MCGPRGPSYDMKQPHISRQLWDKWLALQRRWSGAPTTAAPSIADLFSDRFVYECLTFRRNGLVPFEESSESVRFRSSSLDMIISNYIRASPYFTSPDTQPLSSIYTFTFLILAEPVHLSQDAPRNFNEEDHDHRCCATLQFWRHASR